MSWVLIGILVVVVLLVIYAIALYNGLVRNRNRVDNAWAQIEVQLKRRRDLIPNGKHGNASLQTPGGTQEVTCHGLRGTHP